MGRRKYRSSGVKVKRRRTSSSSASHASVLRSFGISLPLPSFASLILLQILLNGGLIDLCIEQRTLNVAMSQLLAHGRHRYPCLKELTGSAVTQLVDRCLDPSRLAVLLPSIMHHSVLQRKRTATIAGITAKDGAGGNTALFKMSPQQTNALWSCGEHDGSFPLAFAKDADPLIIGAQIHLCRQQTECLPHPNTRFIEQRKESPITQIGGRNGLENLRHCFRRQRAWFTLYLLDRIKPFHRIRLDHKSYMVQ